MKVLVVGSLPVRTDPTPTADDNYGKACHDIGVEMAKRDWTIGVGTDRPDSADFLIVEGARQSGRALDVNVYWHDKEDKGEIPFPDDNDDNGFHHIHGPSTWVAGRHKQIKDSDVVLLIGGGDKTAPAFHQARDLLKPCLPVPGFGGASEEVWGIFVADTRSLRLDPEGERSKLQPWQEGTSAHALLDFVERYVKLKPYSARKSPYLAIVLAIALCALSAWMFLVFGQSTPVRYTVFGLLAASSILGAAWHWLWYDWYKGAEDGTQEGIDSFIARAGIALIEAFALFLFLLVGSLAIDGNISFLDSLSSWKNLWRLAFIISLFGLAAGFMTDEITKSLGERLAGLGKESKKGKD